MDDELGPEFTIEALDKEREVKGHWTGNHDGGNSPRCISVLTPSSGSKM